MRDPVGMDRDWLVRAATPRDAEWLADLKAAAMRSDLERLGRWDRGRARARFLESYVPATTRVVVVDNEDMGCITARPELDAWWIEHFYLWPRVQGRGLGGEVLEHTVATHQDGRPFMLAMVRDSPARHLYERHRFIYDYDDENGVDQIFRRSGDAGAGSASRNH